MKILFKVIVLVSVLVCCFILWKLYNNFNINKGQFVLAYGLIILIGGIVIGWLTDYDFKNQSKYDNREADPLSDWVKIQDRDKSKTRWGKFWNELFGDPDADWLLGQMLQWEFGNYYDRNELKSVEEIINKPAKPKNTFRDITEQIDKNLGKPYQSHSLPMLVVDEVHKGNAEAFKKIANEVELELRQPYEPYAGCWNQQEKELGRIVTAQMKEDKFYSMPTNEEGNKRRPYKQYSGRGNRKPVEAATTNAEDKDNTIWVDQNKESDNSTDKPINPLDHEQSK